jgi:hypothetical protein
MADNFDFRDWTEKVRGFAKGLKKLPGELLLEYKIKPPSSQRTLAVLERKWPQGIPAALRSYWTMGSDEVQCMYLWTPPLRKGSNHGWPMEDTIYGGIHFGTQNVYPANSGADPNDKNLQDGLGKKGLELWCRCAIFHMFGNGDCLGFDPTVNYDDPAVVYLIHDDKTSKQVSPTFTEFLRKWTNAAFLWPIRWGYGQWPFRLTKAQKAEVAELLELAANSGF